MSENTERKPERCEAVGESGDQCAGDALAEGSLCFWHDPDADKSGLDIKQRLEQWAAEGHSMEGFKLVRANLEDVNFAGGAADRRISLAHADLSRANLVDAHFFNTDLHGANLLKADLGGANLNRSNLSGANLLGASLKDAKLEYVDWGRHIVQEDEAIAAEHSGNIDSARALLIEAEEVYRNLGQVSQSGGHSEREGWFFRKVMIMRRRQLPPFSLRRAWSLIVDLICGYGELPVRVIAFSLSVVLACSCVYFLAGINGPEGAIGYSSSIGFANNLFQFLNCIYFSVVTFTTLGYGEIVPSGGLRILAASEAFVGAFTIALFVVVFDKKMTR